MLTDLGQHDQRLKGVYLFQGLGLTSNVYFLGTKRLTLVDAGVGNRPNSLIPRIEALKMNAGEVVQVILTHAHHDHVGGLFEILEVATPKVYLHRLDARYIASYLGPNLVEVDDGAIIETELFSFQVIHTPGHTSGGICLYVKEKRMLFSGDTVFPNGLYGACHGESGSLKEMVHSLRRLTELNVDILLAGHGEPLITDGSNQIMISYNNALRRYRSES